MYFKLGDADDIFAAGESKSRIIITGADPGFSLGGVATQRNSVINANKPRN